MLDRKIKDRHASVELLEDRIKQDKVYAYLMYFISIIFILIAGCWYITINTLSVSMFFLCGAIIAYGGYYTILILISNTDIYLYFKEREEENNDKGV